MRSCWKPGELGAQKLLAAFISNSVSQYGEARDFPSQDGTSSLSPHMHWGELSPRRVWTDVSRSTAGKSKGATKFLAEILWRDFAAHVLVNFPATVSEPLRPEFVKFPWQPSTQHLRAWQVGRTGYPIVDAGMRQLWATGWMHNRVRMIVASFLVKHLLQSWQDGASWFWDTLCDADLASNTLGWQWSAGCGADAAPYFRIFNPILQGEKFDPQGDFVRKWVSELSIMPSEFIHQPWKAPRIVLAASGVELGDTYPQPIIDHPTARDRALGALKLVSPEKSSFRE
jgi:deoxyribodipyrimidine photo-lyase